MSTYEKKFLKCCLIIFAFLFVACVSVTFGRRQAEDWKITNEHLRMKEYGYNYCPYCGEQLKESEEKE